MIKTRSFKFIITAVLTFAIALFGLTACGTISSSGDGADGF